MCLPAAKLRPVLTVSPSWLGPGDSVTLNCTVQDPYEGWTFYWYKATPNLDINFYDTELLPGSSNGTEQSYFIAHGQSRTAGYFCKAGRGNPLTFTFVSQVKFVWSGGEHRCLFGFFFLFTQLKRTNIMPSHTFALVNVRSSNIDGDEDLSFFFFSDSQPAASLSVSPDQTQHFIADTESLSLTCSGDSGPWMVSMISSAGYLTRCGIWGSMTGPTCNIIGSELSEGVYWCESAAGQFSNAVNITGSCECLYSTPPH